MAEQKLGKVTARGSAWFINRVMQALEECVNISNPPLQDRLPREFIVEEHTKAEFKAAGYVFADGTVNEGRVVKLRPQTILWVRSDIMRNKPTRGKHIVRHEIFHPFPVSAAKQGELMLLMYDANGKHPTKWRGAYQARPEECHADTCAEAASGKDSPWDDFDFFRLDVKEKDHKQFLDITLRTDPPPVEEPPTDLPVQPLPPESPTPTVITLQPDQTIIVSAVSSEATETTP